MTVSTRVAERHQQGDRLIAQHELQRAAVERDDLVERPLRQRVKAALFFGRRVLQEARGHHRRQRQGNERGEDDGHRQRHGELAEQAAGDIAHEQQRNQHGDQRNGQRENGEADLLGALQRRLHAERRPSSI